MYLQDNMSDSITLNENYHQIFNSLAEAIFIYDMETGVIIDVNDATCEMLEYSKGELINKSIADLTISHPNFNAATAIKKIDEATKNEKVSFEWKIKTKYKNTIWLDIDLRMINILDKKCVIASCIDITNTKEFQKRAKQLMQIVEQSVDSKMVLDLNGVVTYINPAGEQLFNLSEKDILGKEFDLLNITDVSQESIIESVNTNTIYEDMLLCNKGDHTNFWCYIQATPLVDEETTNGYLVISRDVSESIELNKKLKKLTQEQHKIIEREVAKNRDKDALLVQQSRFAAMGEMISMIAHQWRQPLNAVSAASIALKMRQDLELLEKDYLDEQVNFIQEQVQGMSQTINDFMNFFKPKKKKEKFVLVEVVQKVADMMQAQLKAHSINLHINISKEIEVVAVKNEMEHIILNLLTNSRDAFEERDSKSKEIYINAEIKDNNIYITLEDTAGGIPEDIISKIYDPYFTTKEQGKGTGIGLYMTQSIIVNHFKGSIQLKNTNKGVHFTIILPIKKYKK